MPGPWDDQTEKRLLLSIMDPDLKPKWEIVAGRMGISFTAESCRYVQLLYNSSVCDRDEFFVIREFTKAPGARVGTKLGSQYRLRKLEAASSVLGFPFTV